jgi:DNA polymerase-1
MTDPIFLDFETEAIGPRPHHYPPAPVGLAVLDRTGQFESTYWSFAHDTNNNTDFNTVRNLIIKIFESGRHMCFHNAMFDLSVIYEKFDIPLPPAERIHDTLVLAFLFDPYVRSLSLKELCKEWLGIKPEERDELFIWLEMHIPEVRKKPKTAGAYIARGPANLVGKYACADVRLTAELFDFTEEVRKTMPVAYLREMQLMPVLLENSKLGIRVDTEGMKACLEKAKADIEMCEVWLYKYFNTEDINFNSGVQLVNVVMAKGVYDKTKKWPTSDKGTPLSDKDTLKDMLTDDELSSVLRHRDVLTKLTGTYLEPWLEQSATTGRIFTEWNTVRGEIGGTRTGRLSAKTTLQTMPTRGPKTPLPTELQGLIIPKVRQFILPDEGHMMAAADFQAQELRLFAHFEDGKLAEQYRQDPNADLHAFAANLMSEKSGKTVIRDYAKTMSFGILYGAGPKKICEMLGIPYSEARQLIDLYKSEVAPGLDKVNNDLMARYKIRAPFSTIGGRLVKGEPPKIINGKLMNFGFKSLNTLIQGSGADMTKQAMINYWLVAKDSRLLLSLHDELIISARVDVVQREADKLAACMINSFKLDVPLIADAKIGANFAEVK